MYHSITIGDLSTKTKSGSTYSYVSGKNTWDDWHLIPSTRPLVNPPKPNTKGIQVPGRNGTLDMSKVLTGYMTYQNRTGSWEFIVENDHWDWATAYSTIMGYLHGETKYCTLEDDIGYYYKGLLSVNSWKSDKSWSLITIDYDLYPYKKTVQASDEEWLWDPFNFTTDVIKTYNRSLSAGGTLKWVLQPTLETKKPTIYTSAANNNMVATYKGSTYPLSNGSHKYSWFTTENTEREIVFNNMGSSIATVSITYRGGIF